MTEKYIIPTGFNEKQQKIPIIISSLRYFILFRTLKFLKISQG